VIKCLGQAGNLEAESLRLLHTYDICSDAYEQEVSETQAKSGNKENDPLAGCVGPAFDSLQVFLNALDPQTGEWMIPE
jgi:hypothetical protein